jgi:predicted acyl esterase
MRALSSSRSRSRYVRRRPGRVAVAVVGFALFTVGPVQEAASTSHAPTTYPNGIWAPPAATYGQSQDTNLSVRVSDGAILKVDVVYPADPVTGERLPGPFPVVLNQDPYTFRGNTDVLTGAAPAPNFWAQRGYIYVHLHQRGTGGPGPNGSEGSVDLSFGPRHGLDGVELAYWAAKPANVPGSNGTVGLQGCSALGVIQLSTLAALGRAQRLGDDVYVPGRTADDAGAHVRATRKRNPIKAALPSCFATSIYREQFTDNGVATTQFAAAFLAGAAGAALFGTNTENVAAALDGTTWSLDMQTGGDHGYDRHFWRERDWLRRAADIGYTGVPILMQVGYRESGFTSAQPLFGALQNYAAGRRVTDPMPLGARTSPKYQVIIGDWGHGGGIESGVELQWLETWMRGAKTGLRSAKGALHLEELSRAGDNRWISPTSFPMTNRYRPLYLAPAGALANAPGEGTDQAVWRGGQPLTYTTQPFTDDTTLFGPAAAELVVSSSTSNVQLYVELQDVAPDDTVVEITHGSLIGSRAHLDPVRSWATRSGLPTRPWLALDDDRLLTPGEPTRLDVPLQPRTWRLAAGHRLRMVVATHPGDRCLPTQNILAAPIPYGCVVSSSLLPSLTGGVYEIAQAHSFLSAALVPSDDIPTTPSGPVKEGGEELPQRW